ncbi:UbiX family flavin prenyltransferase [Natrinema gelatinilyticum]|uniref:UbiX family flavin prenyltransferase n=1 Tax=Natrinema gelatinilyticum TaxID=2961571 RepID=UPI0020C2EB6D|nr:UbiX family flavin prenyltransferase [Natrinema gelatinilyticum]
MADRVIIGMTGATGQIYGIRALNLLRETEYESHVILSESARITIKQETEYTPAELEQIADETYSVKNIGAPTASGSFATKGMLISPCSMKTLSNIAHGNAGDLITRSADVTLKERNPLVVMPREKPLNRIHLENMLKVTDAGGIIMPPFPSFYQHETDFDKMISRTVARALSLVDVSVEFEEWSGLENEVVQ